MDEEPISTHALLESMVTESCSVLGHSSVCLAENVIPTGNKQDRFVDYLDADIGEAQITGDSMGRGGRWNWRAPLR